MTFLTTFRAAGLEIIKDKRLKQIYGYEEALTMQKRLYKSSTDKKLDGVCAGIGEYFDIDPTLIRLIWVLAVLFAGTGILAYIVAAVVMPRNPN